MTTLAPDLTSHPSDLKAPLSHSNHSSNILNQFQTASSQSPQSSSNHFIFPWNKSLNRYEDTTIHKYLSDISPSIQLDD